MTALFKVAIAAALLAAPPLQARYDAARSVVEDSRDPAAVRAAWAEIRSVERADHAPPTRQVRIPDLPDTSWRAGRPGRHDRELERALARVARAAPGVAAVWVHDLTSGRVAGWNAEAQIPAASTVKLAAIAAALHARRADLAYDVRQVALWSSNPAANRIVELLGDARIREALTALGMTRSTYPGPYRVGTARAASTRLTTAHDLGRALYRLQRWASGYAGYLPPRTARQALDLLRRSLPYGGNRGLLGPWLPGTPVAQKNGWTTEVRATAAIVYRREGPTIVVVAVTAPKLDEAAARTLGRRVLDAARLRG